jgi:hypothetical protein
MLTLGAGEMRWTLELLVKVFHESTLCVRKARSRAVKRYQDMFKRLRLGKEQGKSWF